MHPALDATPEDAETDASLLESIADWCLRYTPLVACDTPDGLLLDISGCTHLYGGEHELVADLAGRIERAGFAYRIAIAGSIGAAWAAAHYGEPASYAGSEERALLSPLPLAALRLPPVTVAALARVRQPVLIVQGGQDASVPPAHADSLYLGRGKLPTELARFPGLTHFYKVAPPGISPMQSMALDSVSDPAVAERIASWARRLQM